MNRCPGSLGYDYHSSRRYYAAADFYGDVPTAAFMVTCAICGHEQVLDRYYTLPPHSRDGVVLLETGKEAAR